MRVLVWMLLALAALVFPAAVAAAETDRVAVVAIGPDLEKATLPDKLKGDETVTYMFDALQGQPLAVSLSSNHRETIVDVFAPDGTRLHDGAKAGQSWSATAAADGRYAARVMLSRGAAKRGETATYELTLTVVAGRRRTAGEAAAAAGDERQGRTASRSRRRRQGDGRRAPSRGGQAAPPRALTERPAATEPNLTEIARAVVNPASEDKGAERYWAVTGVPSKSSLPVYREPGVESSIMAELPPDAAGLRNLGCRMASGARWCKIEVGTQPKEQGWVAGRYLRAISSRDRDAKSDSRGRRLRTITGIIACTPSGAKKAGQCEARVQRAAPGLAIVYVTLPDGAVRVLNFRNEDVFVLNPDIAMKWQVKGSDYVVTINGNEKLVIPRLVITGGTG